MKQLVVMLILVALAGLGLGLWLIDDPGYLLVIRDRWQLETTLGFALMMLVLAGTAVAIVTLLLSATWDIVSPFGATGRWQGFLARYRLQRGFHALVEGHWQKAERLLSAAARAPQWRIMAALGAAEAAAEQGADEAVRRHLELARDGKRGRLPAGLMAAHLALERGHPAQARDELLPLRDVSPRNPRLLRMLAESWARTGNWSELLPLLPVLRTPGHDPAEMRDLERRTWHGVMRQTAESPDPADARARLDALRAVWKKLPAELQREPGIRAQYAGYLAQYGDGEAALTLVRKDLDRNWDDRLPAVLESVTNVAPERLLALLESWLEIRPGNTVLLLTAGRVALRARLWGKARGFFEAAGNAGSATALAELARLYAALNETDRALAVLEKRLRLMDAHLPDLPLPGRVSS